MKLHVNNLNAVAIDWIKEVIFPKSNEWLRAAIAGVIAVKPQQIESKISMIKFYADDEGYIDVNTLESIFNEYITERTQPLKLTLLTNPLTEEPLLVWDLDKVDVSKAFEIAKRYSK